MFALCVRIRRWYFLHHIKISLQPSFTLRVSELMSCLERLDILLIALSAVHLLHSATPWLPPVTSVQIQRLFKYVLLLLQTLSKLKSLLWSVKRTSDSKAWDVLYFNYCQRIAWTDRNQQCITQSLSTLWFPRLVHSFRPHDHSFPLKAWIFKHLKRVLYFIKAK